MRRTAAIVADAFANENALPHDMEGRFLSVDSSQEAQSR